MQSSSEIYISYAWGGGPEELVDKIYNTLKSDGFNVIRDKVDLRYKGKIREFMELLGSGNAVIMVLSDKYLRSKSCMYEAIQIKKNGNWDQRVFPIIHPDANLWEPEIRLKYIRHWERKKIKLENEIRKASDLSKIKNIMEEVERYADVRQFIDQFMEDVSNVNVLTPDIHEGENFVQLKTMLAQLVKKNPSTVHKPSALSFEKDLKTLLEQVEGFCKMNNIKVYSLFAYCALLADQNGLPARCLEAIRPGLALSLYFQLKDHSDKLLHGAVNIQPYAAVNWESEDFMTKAYAFAASEQRTHISIRDLAIGLLESKTNTTVFIKQQLGSNYQRWLEYLKNYSDNSTPI